MIEINKIKWIKYLIGFIIVSIYLHPASDVLSQQIFRNNDSLFSECPSNFICYLNSELFELFYTYPYNDDSLFVYGPLNILNNPSFYCPYLSFNYSYDSYFPWLLPSFFEMVSLINMNSSSATDSIVNEENETYAVYSAVIDTKYTRNKMFIYDHTYAPGMDAGDWFKDFVLESVPNILENLDGISQEIIEDYINKNYLDENDQAYPLSNLFTIEREYELVDSNDYHILEISRVGFNPVMDQAVVYTGMMLGMLCGTGYYHFLIKEDGLWKVKDSQLAWIS